MTEETPESVPETPGNEPTPPPVDPAAGATPPPPPAPQGPPAPQAPPLGVGGVAAPQPGAPFGIDPVSGLPCSDKTKLIAGLLQILLPFGIGRMYMGQVGLGVAQLAVTVLTCGAGGLWSIIDGILILVGQPKDDKGLPLR